MSPTGIHDVSLVFPNLNLFYHSCLSIGPKVFLFTFSKFVPQKKFKKICAENIPKPGKEIVTQVQEVQCPTQD